MGRPQRANRNSPFSRVNSASISSGVTLPLPFGIFSKDHQPLAEGIKSKVTSPNSSVIFQPNRSLCSDCAAAVAIPRCVHAFFAPAGLLRQHPPARRALNQSLLQQVRLNHLFQRIAAFRQRRRQRLNPHRAAARNSRQSASDTAGPPHPAPDYPHPAASAPHQPVRG